MFEQKIRWGIGQIMERLEKAEAELAKAMDQRDGLAAKLAELCEQKPVVKYMSRRLTPVGTKEMWGYDLVDGLSDGIMLYAGPVQLPVVADCRTCKNRGCTNGLSQESFCESCVWQLMSFRKNHYAPNSPDFEGIKMVELPKNDAAPVPAVAAVPEDYRQALVEIALRCTDHDTTDAIDALLQSANHFVGVTDKGV